MRSFDFFDRLLLAAGAFGVGVAVGLLTAPATGTQTRRRLADSTRDATTAAQSRAGEMAAPIAERARTQARELSQRHLPLSDDLELLDAETLRDVARDSSL